MCYSALVIQSLKTLENRFLAHPVRQSFTDYEQKSQQDPKRFKRLTDHPRIYPGYSTLCRPKITSKRSFTSAQS